MTVPGPAPGSADPNDAAMIGQILRHPAFPQAMRLIGRRFLALHADYMVSKLIADEGRYLVCHFAIALHAGYRPEDSGSGLTLSRLMKQCLAFQVLSRGRVEAMVALLRRTGRLVDAPPGPDRRIRRLLPGPPLEAEFRERVRFHLEALEMVMPGRSYLRRLEADPDFYWALERERGVYVADQPSLRLRLPALAAVSDIEGGYLTLVALLDALPDPIGPGDIAFPHVETAERLRLPRTQLRRVLEGLEAAGLVQPLAPAGHALRVLPLAVETMATWHAIRLLRFDRNGARAAAARDGFPFPAVAHG
jgi:hypothetical protein